MVKVIGKLAIQKFPYFSFIFFVFVCHIARRQIILNLKLTTSIMTVS